MKETREWNRGRPENYAYVDRTPGQWTRRVLPEIGCAGDVDSYYYCRLCSVVLAVVEHTRNPAHRTDDVARLAASARTPALVMMWDGSAPKTLYQVTPGTDQHLIHRHMETLLESVERDGYIGDVADALATGQVAIRASLGLMLLRHYMAAHPGVPEIHMLARTLQVEITETPE